MIPEDLAAKGYVVELWPCTCTLMDGEINPYCLRCWGLGELERFVFRGEGHLPSVQDQEQRTEAL